MKYCLRDLSDLEWYTCQAPLAKSSVKRVPLARETWPSAGEIAPTIQATLLLCRLGGGMTV